VLDAVVDAVKIGERDGASFVDVTKTVRRAAA
jgi:hypothetical protein